MKIALLTLCIALTSSVASADEYLIFKRMGDDLGVAALPHRYTVWHIDALKSISVPIEADVSRLTDQQAAFTRASELLNAHSREYLMALFLMSYAAREKMHQYGLTATPSAVLLNDAGQVLETWSNVSKATDLLPAELK